MFFRLDAILLSKILANFFISQNKAKFRKWPISWNFGCSLDKLTYEPPHDKTNKMTCAPSKDSDQPGYLPSLIRVFAVRMKKALVLSYPLSAQLRLIRLLDTQADLSLCWAQSFYWFCHEVAYIEPHWIQKKNTQKTQKKTTFWQMFKGLFFGT